MYLAYRQLFYSLAFSFVCYDVVMLFPFLFFIIIAFSLLIYVDFISFHSVFLCRTPNPEYIYIYNTVDEAAEADDSGLCCPGSLLVSVEVTVTVDASAERNKGIYIYIYIAKCVYYCV